LRLGKTVRQLLAELDSAELTEWRAYDEIEGLEGRADLRAGIVAAAAANHGFRQLKEPYTAADFMPFLKRAAPAPILLEDPAEQSALILSAVFNRKVT